MRRSLSLAARARLALVIASAASRGAATVWPAGWPPRPRCRLPVRARQDPRRWQGPYAVGCPEAHARAYGPASGLRCRRPPCLTARRGSARRDSARSAVPTGTARRPTPGHRLFSAGRQRAPTDRRAGTHQFDGGSYVRPAPPRAERDLLPLATDRSRSRRARERPRRPRRCLRQREPRKRWVRMSSARVQWGRRKVALVGAGRDPAMCSARSLVIAERAEGASRTDNRALLH